MRADPDGAVDAFEEFYRAERQSAVRLAWLLTREPTAAEDVAHDAFAAVHTRFGSLDNPSAYLRRCIVNGVRERARRRERELRRNQLVVSGVATAAEGPTSGAIDAIAKLPMNQRTAVVLRYWAQMRDREIAEVMDVRVGTVRSTLSRATAQLRKELLR